MKPHSHSVILELPPLSDEVAVQLRDSLYDFVCAWENSYGEQIRRHYAKQEEWAPLAVHEKEEQLNLFDESDLPPF